MNVRDTSIESYKKVVESGFLSEKLIKTFTIIFRFGPLTSRQANTHFIRTYGGENNLNQLRSKISMLQDMGVVAAVDKVKCYDTDQTVYQFDVTGLLPVRSKKLSMADKKRDMLATVERLDKGTWPWCAMEIDNLKQQINNL